MGYGACRFGWSLGRTPLKPFRGVRGPVPDLPRPRPPRWGRLRPGASRTERSPTGTGGRRRISSIFRGVRQKTSAEPANCRISSFQLPSSFAAHSAIELPGLSAGAGFEPTTSALRSAFELPDPSVGAGFEPAASGCLCARFSGTPRGRAQGRRRTFLRSPDAPSIV